MSGASQRPEAPAQALLPIYRTDVAEMVERVGTWRRQGEGVVEWKERRYVTFFMPRS